ncbi:hypothetical protein ABZP36_003650 [Zizania latifolia]
MSISRRSPDDQMAAFWAPFLLLHLGGPDTITAYAMEDNQLWLRHMLTLVGQVAGAAYVLYLYIIATATNSRLQLVAAATLMFLCGLVKYGERTWALKCASIDNIASSLYRSSGESSSDMRPYSRRERGEEKLDTEEILLRAHYLLDFCKVRFIAGPLLGSLIYTVEHAIHLEDKDVMYLYELVEMQLSLMYDILYTKAAMIHTWYGCCIRIVSPLCAVAAFLMFQFSNKDAYRRVDVTITYVLFVGALIMEVIASIRVAGSSWACASLHARGWLRLSDAVMRLRRLLKTGNRRRAGMDSLGQFNMLELCTSHAMSNMSAKITKAMGLNNWWNRLRYSTTISVSRDIKTFVLEEIQKRSHIDESRNSRGRWTLEKMGIYEDLKWMINNVDMDHTILVWHIAMDLYLASHGNNIQGSDVDQMMMSNMIRMLSNYMMFLLVAHPYLLPGVIRHIRYKTASTHFSLLWLARSTEDDKMNPSASFRVKKILEWELLINDDDDGSPPDDRVNVDGTRLARMLLSNKWNIAKSDMLKAIAGVWVELLFFAGHHCGEESHLRKLSSGCEFVTVVWVLNAFSFFKAGTRKHKGEDAEESCDSPALLHAGIHMQDRHKAKDKD